MKRSSCGKNALISVIVPVYNAKQYLPDCLESLLSQTCPNLEILLVDDGSTDGSAEWIKAFIHSYEWKEGKDGSGSIRAGRRRTRAYAEQNNWHPPGFQ